MMSESDGDGWFQTLKMVVSREIQTAICSQKCTSRSKNISKLFILPFDNLLLPKNYFQSFYIYRLSYCNNTKLLVYLTITNYVHYLYDIYESMSNSVNLQDRNEGIDRVMIKLL